ncbi:hypothetical protein [Dietzia sp. 179-F 9C3 NHS]|uniref:hypothetical protein n=1 Tax=Dietzia sp. 179-F 9C3 NHS TaxID=3374295 RepID=UPI00387959AE
MIFAQLETKLVLSALLRHFEWTVPADYTPPMRNESLPYPGDGLPVALRPRQPQRPAGTTAPVR